MKVTERKSGKQKVGEEREVKKGWEEAERKTDRCRRPQRSEDGGGEGWTEFKRKERWRQLFVFLSLSPELKPSPRTSRQASRARRAARSSTDRSTSS